MARKDPRVDAYIAKAAPFARPILKHVRKLVHRACPDAVETLKWSAPFYEHHGLLVGMAAFKQHCAVIFWRASRLPAIQAAKGRDARGHFGRITALKDLPSDATLVTLVRQAALLNESGSKVKRVVPSKPKPAPRVPADLRAALAKHRRAKATFDAFAPSHRREYVEWIAGAKRPETRARRLATAIEWLAAGKTQNWRYERRK